MGEEITDLPAVGNAVALEGNFTICDLYDEFVRIITSYADFRYSVECLELILLFRT